MTMPAKPHRRTPVDYEGNEQAALFNWLRLRHPAAYRMAFHVPNGGHRHKAVAAKLKAQGVKAGVPDIAVMLARGGFHGLFIEFKAAPPHTAAVADSQAAWVEALECEGYRATVCKGVSDAINEIDGYMALGATEVVGD